MPEKITEEVHEALMRSACKSSQLVRGPILDDSFGVNCPGCDKELTGRNASGLENLCLLCSKNIPDKRPENSVPTGKFPNLYWKIN